MSEYIVEVDDYESYGQVPEQGERENVGMRESYGEVCGDDRFELIGKAKALLREATNIEMRPDEMAVIDSILFHCWQMGWLDKLRDTEAEAVKAWNTRAEMSYEDVRILLDELGLSERTCHPVIAITDDGGYEYALCSECDDRIEPEDNYCPNCGCKVVSE